MKQKPSVSPKANSRDQVLFCSKMGISQTPGLTAISAVPKYQSVKYYLFIIFLNVAQLNSITAYWPIPHTQTGTWGCSKGTWQSCMYPHTNKHCPFSTIPNAFSLQGSCGHRANKVIWLQRSLGDYKPGIVHFWVITRLFQQLHACRL